MPVSITGERIKQRRKELGMSADSLAAKIGVSRATMYRYESGDIEKVPVDLISPLAKELGISGAYLMGWDDENSCAGSSAANDLKTVIEIKETHLIRLYRKLNSEGQEKLIDYADDLVTSGKYILFDWDPENA